MNKYNDKGFLTKDYLDYVRTFLLEHPTINADIPLFLLEEINKLRAFIVASNLDVDR